MLANPLIISAAGWLLCLYGLWLTRHDYGWQKLKTQRDFQHLLFASWVALLPLWWLKAGLLPQLDVHILALTTLTLMHGPRLAYVLGCALMLVQSLLYPLSWQHLPWLTLTTVALPIISSYLLLRLCLRYLPANPFSYIFVAGFFNAALAIVLQIFTTGLYIGLVSDYSWQQINENYWQLALLLWFAEGLLNGMVLTLMLVYRPNWLRTFDDAHYLQH